MSKVLDEINSKYGKQLTAEKIDVSVAENADIARKFKVRYVPHLLFMDASGNVVKESVGYMPLDEVLKTFKEAGINVE